MRWTCALFLILYQLFFGQLESLNGKLSPDSTELLRWAQHMFMLEELWTHSANHTQIFGLCPKLEAVFKVNIP